MVLFLFLTLGYTLETNYLEGSQRELLAGQKLQTELALHRQETLEQLSLIKSSDDAKRLEGELNLEPMKGFTLLRPKGNQLSLSEGFYEL